MSCEATCKKTSEMKPVNGERTVAAFGQKHAGKAKLVSDAPTTTILALTVTFGSMVSFLFMWVSCVKGKPSAGASVKPNRAVQKERFIWSGGGLADTLAAWTPSLLSYVSS
ncbi:hypothetical protein DNTS_035852 [Danionella cerebrum]|uniref:Uncharacterized protein n=1 Tax=Danionella cerebrum TaxID=2873325 RepID=A0A553Q3K4_9TELE|nr:hypothetical protein DNTS_035852 [Danionella translucida]